MLTRSIAQKVLKRFDGLEKGHLKILTPDGKTYDFEGQEKGHCATIRVADWKVFSSMAWRGNIGLADDYRTGAWDTDDLQSLIALGLDNKAALREYVIGHPLFRKLSALSYLKKLNTLRGSRKNIHDHYDLGNDFYKLWLDPTMSYSSALFKSGEETMPEAQHNKYDRILERMKAASGSVLEIGCGWGGFAERALQKGDFDLKGITLSTEQQQYAQQRLGGTAQIALQDYRVQSGKFDRIVSIEMFEAVGERFWPTYFNKIGSLLKTNGRAVIQSITINESDFPRYRKGADFIRSYIFPGGMLPSPSAFRASARAQGLRAENEFFFGQDYARTLEEWLLAFDSCKDEVLRLGYDEGFIRLWRLYLASCAAAFRHGQINVMQVELRHA